MASSSAKEHGNATTEVADVINVDDESSDPSTGLTLPIARIKKIIKLDPEHVSSTEAANYMLGLSAELFVMNLTEKASLITKSNKRKKIMYDDFYKAINHDDKLLFLKDLVPKTRKLSELVDNGMVSLSDKDMARFNMQQKKVVDEDETTTEEPTPAATAGTTPANTSNIIDKGADDDNETIDLDKEDEEGVASTSHSTIAPKAITPRKEKRGRKKKAPAVPAALSKGQKTLNFFSTVAPKTGEPKKIKVNDIVEVLTEDEDDAVMVDP